MTRSDTGGLRIVPGYADSGWVLESPQFGPGLRARIGAHHLPLAELLNAVISAGFVVDRVVEAGAAMVPWMLAVLARKG